MPARARVDVCIVGGGPAGAVAARLLASWGWTAVLLHRAPTAPPLAESLPPSTRKALSLVGVDTDVDVARLFPNTGNSARWAGRDRHLPSPAPGVHVARDEWDALLLGSAARAGARVVEATVRHVDPRGGGVIAVDHEGRPLSFESEYVLDCSGRAGLVARQGLRRRDADHLTVAVAGEWQTPRWPASERTHTFVESYNDGWSWSVPLASDVRQCTVMIDPRRVTGRPGRGDRLSRAALQRVYERELAKTTGVRDRLHGARQIKPAWACDASVYDAVRAADGRAILAGDAASFIEPLSSAGVKKAMLSAWRAAIVANTCLKSDARRTMAFDFHTAREHDVSTACARQARAFFAEAAAAHGGDFWHARASFGAAATGAEALDTSADAILSGGDVLSAFERIRSAPSRLVVSPRLEHEPSATIEGHEIVLRDALRLPGLARPVRFASNVDLPALVNVVTAHDDVDSVMAAYRAEVNPVTPADLLRGLSLLVARRAILHEGVRP